VSLGWWALLALLAVLAVLAVLAMASNVSKPALQTRSQALEDTRGG
jgi:hypothetical protein